MKLLHSPQPPPTESMLTALLNDITTVPDNFMLVLDDYHVIDSQPVDQTLIFLLKHLPPQMRNCSLLPPLTPPRREIWQLRR